MCLRKCLWKERFLGGWYVWWCWSFSLMSVDVCWCLITCGTSWLCMMIFDHDWWYSMRSKIICLLTFSAVDVSWWSLMFEILNDNWTSLLMVDVINWWWLLMFDDVGKMIDDVSWKCMILFNDVAPIVFDDTWWYLMLCMLFEDVSLCFLMFDDAWFFIHLQNISKPTLVEASGQNLTYKCPTNRRRSFFSYSSADVAAACPSSSFFCSEIAFRRLLQWLSRKWEEGFQQPHMTSSARHCYTSLSSAACYPINIQFSGSNWPDVGPATVEATAGEAWLSWRLKIEDEFLENNSLVAIFMV